MWLVIQYAQPGEKIPSIPGGVSPGKIVSEPTTEVEFVLNDIQKALFVAILGVNRMLPYTQLEKCAAFKCTHTSMHFAD